MFFLVARHAVNLPPSRYPFDVLAQQDIVNRFYRVFCGPARLALTEGRRLYLLKGPHGYFQLFSIAETLENSAEKKFPR